MSDKSIPFPSHLLFLRSVLFVVYASAEVTMFLSADISRKRLGASLNSLRSGSLVKKLCSISWELIILPKKQTVSGFQLEKMELLM